MAHYMELLTELILQLHIPAQLWAPDGSVICTNQHFNELFGLPAAFDWAKADWRAIEDPQFALVGLEHQFQRALAGEATELYSVHYNPQLNPHVTNRKAGALRLGVVLRPLFGHASKAVCVACFVSDYASVTGGSENQMMRIQKMENLETLASGVAHEFNNIFTGIKGLTELIRDEADVTSETYEFATAIQVNISRGADLIQQLSSFAREMPHSLRVKRLSRYIEAALPLMKITVQRRITLDVVVKCDGDVLIDHNRMDQALANVLHNARDAMGGQGRVLLTVDQVAPAPEAGLDRPSGEWMMIEIADSGQGIPAELRERVLEPFFSTKERGKSTGLGLSVTNRIVLSHGGLMQIGQSEELGGAAIRVFLPLIAQSAQASEQEEQSAT
jgi:signal transduction histidine kinase